MYSLRLKPHTVLLAGEFILNDNTLKIERVKAVLLLRKSKHLILYLDRTSLIWYLSELAYFQVIFIHILECLQYVHRFPHLLSIIAFTAILPLLSGKWNL